MLNWPEFFSFKRYLDILTLFSKTNSQAQFLPGSSPCLFFRHQIALGALPNVPIQKWQMNIPTEDDFITIFDRQQRSQDLGQAVYQLLADIKAEHPERFPPTATEPPAAAAPTTDEPK